MGALKGLRRLTAGEPHGIQNPPYRHTQIYTASGGTCPGCIPNIVTGLPSTWKWSSSSQNLPWAWYRGRPPIHQPDPSIHEIQPSQLIVRGPLPKFLIVCVVIPPNNSLSLLEPSISETLGVSLSFDYGTQPSEQKGITEMSCHIFM